MAGINYLFPPDQVLNLPTWRFVLHFMVTPRFDAAVLHQAITNLKAAHWKIITFPFGLDRLSLGESGEAVSVSIEVPEESRKRQDSLAEYESDVWKIMGNLMSAGDGFGEIFYEAVDWKE